MLAIWLNLAFLPCAMALEAPDLLHDCCPSTIELQTLDCCELDDFTVDKRDGGDGHDSAPSAVECRVFSPAVRSDIRLAVPPPDPDSTSPPLHVLNCIYLK